MPVDDTGMRADIIVDPLSVFNRMNPSQWYEQLTNRISYFVQQRMKTMVAGGDYAGAYQLLIEYLSDINPKWGELIEESHPTENSKNELVDECVEDFIYVQHSPFLKSTNQDTLVAVAEKYGVDKTPVTFFSPDENGLWQPHRTKQAVMVGHEYWYLLYKMPHMRCSGIGYVNQYHIPSKPDKGMRYQMPFATTAVRFGEDEFRQLVMIVGPEKAARISALYGLSPEATNVVAETLLYSRKPGSVKEFNISTSTAAGTNTIRSVLIHLFSALGIDIQEDLDSKSAEELAQYLTSEELLPAFAPRVRKTRRKTTEVVQENN